MPIELIEVKIDTDINRKTVVVFDPAYEKDMGHGLSHAKLLKELFPDNTLFFRIEHFTLSSLREGNVAPGLSPTDLVSLNPAIFILETDLIASVPVANLAVKLLKNLETEKRLCEIKRVVVTDFSVSRTLARKLASFGITETNIFSWNAFRLAWGFRNMIKGIV